MKREWIPLDAWIVAAASVVGKKEGDGPLGKAFDLCDPTDRFGCLTWEGAESEMQRMSLVTALAKSGLKESDVGALFAGDLLNQCVGSAYGLLSFDIPYFGLYGACSTCAEGLLLASVFVTGGVCDYCGVTTSSHYCAAERQYRTPLEYGAQRPPTAQWTVTGAGTLILGSRGCPEDRGFRRVRVVRGLPGRSLDAGIADAGNMGAAMAPAACDTLVRFFRGTGDPPDRYDRIVTGDLGYEGGTILCDLMDAAGYPIRDRFDDCGRMIFDRKRQDVHCGGSGCGCSASVLAASLLPDLERGTLRRILFLSTGAMMSPDSIKRGEKIPAIAHLLELEHR